MSLTNRRVASWIFGLSLFFFSVGETLSEKDADKSKHLTIEVLNSTSIGLRWSPSQPGRSGDRVSCPVQGHVIRLKQDGQRQSRTWRFDGAKLSVTLHDLRPATIYQVRLLSIDCENKRKTSRWMKVTTSDDNAPTPGQESRLPGKPNDVRTMTQSEAVVVTWRPPDGDVIVRGYIIGYGEGVPDVNWRYLNSSQRNVTLKNLKPQTQYVISVRAFNNVGKGHVIYDIVHTKEASAASPHLPPPTHLRSRMLSPTTALLQWSDPSLDPTQRIADERYYNVYYQSVPNGKNLSVIVKALQVTLYDLLPNKNYRFTVRTIKGSSTSPFSDPISSRTPSTGSTKGKTSTTPNYEEDEYFEYEIETRPGQDGAFIDGGDDDDGGPRGGPDPQGGPGSKGGPGPQGGGGEAKAKRDNTVVHESLARTLANTSSTSTTTSDVRVTSFRFMVQYRVSAYVTWPERPPGQCSSSSSAAAAGGDDVTATSGYLFRYKAVDDDAGDYVIRSLVTNFVLLENLIPNTRYRYQVRYVAADRGNATSWSQEAMLDTSYNPSLSLQ